MIQHTIMYYNTMQYYNMIYYTKPERAAGSDPGRVDLPVRLSVYPRRTLLHCMILHYTTKPHYITLHHITSYYM